jgi:hypothetical protein
MYLEFGAASAFWSETYILSNCHKSSVCIDGTNHRTQRLAHSTRVVLKDWTPSAVELRNLM